MRHLTVALPAPLPYRRVAIGGWVLYAFSWITPSLDGSQTGAQVFLRTITLGSSLLFRSGTLAASAIGLLLLFGWLANFSIFVRLSSWARIVWIAAPWMPFAIALLLMNGPHGMSGRLASMLYFYPWAGGIALIHVASIAAGGVSHRPSPGAHV
jgi:hypothetical protein